VAALTLCLFVRSNEFPFSAIVAFVFASCMAKSKKASRHKTTSNTRVAISQPKKRTTQPLPVKVSKKTRSLNASASHRTRSSAAAASTQVRFLYINVYISSLTITKLSHSRTSSSEPQDEIEEHNEEQHDDEEQNEINSSVCI
jgi:Ca2+/H+ antiporter